MKRIKFDYEGEMEGTYVFEDEYYMIQNEKVFVHTEKGFEYTDEFTADQIRIYGEILKSKNYVYELKILEIKEIDNGIALIHAEDGSDFDFWIYEDKYNERRNLYKPGEKGLYRLYATILSAELPEDFRDGVSLEGKDARRFFEWIDEKEALEDEDSSAMLPWPETASYSETENFRETGIYSFYATVNEPAFTDNPGEENGGDLFNLAVMNQFNKEKPRFVQAQFDNAPYCFPKFESEPDDEDDMFCDGWALKGTMRFVVGDEPEEDDNIDDEVLEYGKNPATFPEAKGIYGHDEEDYIEGENGSRWLDPEKTDEYEDREE